MPDAGIARVLNLLGYRTGAGNTWTQHRVLSLRRHHGIPVFDRATDRPKLLTIADAAKLLQVSTPTVRRMIERGLLPAAQPALYAPWAIREEDLTTSAVQRAVDAVRSGRALPRSDATAQLTLEDSST
jgi:excisionase family DNA binding protein